jgi:hypothetical protein
VRTSRIGIVVTIVGCVVALYISAFSFAVMTFGGTSIQFTSVKEWVFDRYMLALFLFPFCLFTFVPRWWSTIPLWLSCLWVSFFPFFLRGDAANKWGHPLGFLGRNRALEIACIMLLPISIQAVSAVRRIEIPKAQRPFL